MSPDVDAVVVVGSGPNGLFAAVALAQAGWRVLVLEAASQPGGGVRTEEVTLPGFRHDICSTAHPLAMASRAFAAVGVAREGLGFAHPEIPLAHPLGPWRSVVLHRDVARTASGLGRDAGRWRRCRGPFRMTRTGWPPASWTRRPCCPTLQSGPQRSGR